jgi:hypothetical protein
MCSRVGPGQAALQSRASGGSGAQSRTSGARQGLVEVRPGRETGMRGPRWAAAGPAAKGPVKRTLTFLIYSNFQTDLNLVRSEGGLPKLKNYK